MTVHTDSVVGLLPEGDSVPKQLPANKEIRLLPEHAGDARHASGNGEAAPKKKGAIWIVVAGVGLIVLASIFVFALVLLHHHKIDKVRGARDRELAKGPKLTIAHVQTSEPVREITLPGEVRGFNQATLYAKVSGYVSEIRVDRGDHVKAGDVLAIIESPETRDDVLSAQSNREYTKRTAQRLDGLSVSGVVSMLDRDNAVNAAKRADADLLRAKNVFNYTVVKAPFDGVITARYVDPGALVPAATSATQQAQPVVDLADVDRVRIFVYIGQDAAAFVKSGDAVSIYEDETPGLRIPGTMTRVAGALDPRSRTMQCEVDLDNRAWHLIPGTFAHVRVSVAIPPTPVVPNDALVTRDGTAHVAIVEGNKVHYKPIEVGTDDGKTTRVQSGLSGGETIGMNVPVEIEDGDTVQPIEPDAKNKAGGASDTKSAAGSPTTTPTSEAPPPPPGPDPAFARKGSEPNVTPENGIDAGRAK